MALIGLSLSFCIRDIAAGDVDVSNVELIVAGTACRTAEQWRDVLERYERSYWVGYPHASLLAAYLIETGKVTQPRVEGFAGGHNISGGHWVEV
jgi:hypothetical protein